MLCRVTVTYGDMSQTLVMPSDYGFSQAVSVPLPDNKTAEVLVYYERSFTMVDGVPSYNYWAAARCGDRVRALSRNRPAVLWGDEPIPIDSSWDPAQQEATHEENTRRLAAGVVALAELVNEHDVTVRPPHSEGKTCADCWLCSPRRGAETFNRVTNTYINGSVQAFREITAQYARQIGAPHLTSENVGACSGPGGVLFTSIYAPACEHFTQRPANVPLDVVRPGEYQSTWNYDEKGSEAQNAKS